MASLAALEVVWAVGREREVRLARRKLKVVSQVREKSGAVTEEQLLSLSEDSSRLVEAMEDMVVGTCKCLFGGACDEKELHITVLYIQHHSNLLSQSITNCHSPIFLF